MRQSACLCPHLDRRDPRCAELLTLTNLPAAFRLCAGDHESCSTYHQIRLEDARRERELPAVKSA